MEFNKIIPYQFTQWPRHATNVIQSFVVGQNEWEKCRYLKCWKNNSITSTFYFSHLFKHHASTSVVICSIFPIVYVAFTK